MAITIIPATTTAVSDDPGRLPGSPAAPREIAQSLAGEAHLWRPLVKFTDPRFYTRLSIGPDWEAWLLAWLPGQSTALHDHGGSSGAFAVLAGSVDESLPVSAGGAAGDPGRTHLVSRRYRAGQVRCFGSEHVHDVAASTGRRAVTLHVYRPRLTTMTRYALAGGELVATSRELAGRDS